MKKIIISIIILLSLALVTLNSCAPTQSIDEKTGAQLWGENCNRCHNAPSMEQYTKEHWSVIGDHMRMRANLTNAEVNKIVAFLQGEQ